MKVLKRMNTETIVRTSAGTVRGEVRDGVLIFRGIPYGGSTEGENRFLPPVPVKKWEGVRDCTVNGPICMQAAGSVQTWDDQGPAFHGGHPEKFKAAHEIKSENCLVLNILTPAADGKKRPVLFYIHGGGYSGGSGVLILGADALCREEDVVLVSVNHRIGPFGYLYLGALDEKYRLSGIAGLLDLVAALKWVRENIAAFGGDPSKVTVLGESGGGSKVSALLSMNCTEGLFRTAVIESGAAPAAFHTKESGAAVAEFSLQRLGIDPAHPEQLAALSQEQLQSLTEAFSPYARSYVPTPDGEVMPLWDDRKYHLAPWAKTVRVIIGSSTGESAVFENASHFRMSREKLKALLTEQPDPALLIPVAHPLCPKEKAEALIGYLEQERPAVSSDPELRYAELYYRVLSQPQFNAPALDAGIQLKQAGVRQLYEYLVEYRSHHPAYPDYRFAWHTATLPLQMRIVLHPEDEPLARQLSRLLGDILRNAPELRLGAAEWKEFTENDRQQLIVDSCPVCAEDPQKQLRSFLNPENLSI